MATPQTHWTKASPLISRLFVLVVILVLALENPKVQHEDEDENQDDSISEDKILVTWRIGSSDRSR